jgi:hypothetical protein
MSYLHMQFFRTLGGNDEDEVTLQDMQSLAASRSDGTVTSPVLLKSGFSKIRQTARLTLY